MNNKLVQILAALAIAVVVVALWRSPSTAATDVGEVLGWIGNTIEEAFDKLADFFSEL